MKALWHIDGGSSKLIDVETLNKSVHLQDPILLKAKYSLVSTGTERLVSLGKVSSQLGEKMKVPYMDGSFSLPIKYGYSMIAEESGTAYHVMHPHQEQMQVNKSDLYKVPHGIPLHRLPLISNLETVANAIWDADISTNDKVAICGFGNIGALLANTLSVHFDIEVDIIEVDAWRIDKAKSLGWSVNKGIDYDIIFHTTAIPSVLVECMEKLNIEGKIIELSWYGDKVVSLPLGGAFHYNRLQIISSQVSKIPLSKIKEHTYQSRKELACNWLLHDSYDSLITDLIPFEKSPEFYNKLRKNEQGDGLIWIISYD